MGDRRKGGDRRKLDYLLLACALCGVLALGITALFSIGVIGNARQIDTNAEVLAKAERALDELKHAARARARETRQRVDQDCLKEERDHKKDVQNLRRTYAFLLTYPPAQREDPLYVALIQMLPQTEQAAKTDNAPPYCDERDAFGNEIGLPEPDPKIPKRPKGISGP